MLTAPRHTARDYQARALDAIRATYASGKRAILAVSPTASGKTFMGLAVSAEQFSPRIWIAPSNDLVRQVVDRLAKEGGVCSWFSTDGKLHGRIDDPESIHVTTVQRLASAYRRGLPLPPAAFVVFDEARSMCSPEWGLVAANYRPARILALDATPIGPQGQGLGAFCDHLIEVETVANLTRAGYLAPCKVLSPPEAQPELLTTLDANKKPRKDAPLAVWEQCTPGEPAIVFCASVAEAIEHAGYFRAAGVTCEAIHQDVPSARRGEIFKAYEAGEIDVITNALIARQGIDLTRARVIILARVLGSLSALLQCIGRGLRPLLWCAACSSWSPPDMACLRCGVLYPDDAPRKLCTVLDLTGSVHRIGGCGGGVHTCALPARAYPWSLDGTAAQLLAALPPCVCCSGCLAWHEGGACPHCGAAPLPPPKMRVKVADLVEVREATTSPDKKAAALARYVGEAYTRARRSGKVGADADRSAWSGVFKFQSVYGACPKPEALAAIRQAREAYRPPAEPSGAQLSLV